MIVEYTRYKIAEEDHRPEFERAYEKAQAAFIASLSRLRVVPLSRRRGQLRAADQVGLRGRASERFSQQP